MMNEEIRAYCAEEVRRQGRGIVQTGFMLAAWDDALARWIGGYDLTLDIISRWGKIIEPEANGNEGLWRGVNIWIGNTPGPRVDDLTRLLDRWMWNLPDMTPEEAYKTFEEIHPFADGNGRTGKIILNWLNHSLLHPIWPPNFWNISNP